MDKSQEIAAIDDQISTTFEQETLQLLNSRRNSLIPIAYLPTEVLSRVFSCHVEELRPSQMTDDFPNELRSITPNDWLWFAQVCQHWRTVALGTATLWSTPDFRFRKLSLEMVKRSKPAPLNVLLHVGEDMDIIRSVCEEVLRKEFSRIGLLDFYLHKDCALRVFKEIRGAEGFPMLHSFTFFLGGIDPPRHALSLPHGLFAEPPPLRLLVLHNLDCNKSRSSGLLKNLTTLHLSLEEGFAQPIPFEKLLSVLEDCHELQELMLEGCLDELNPARTSNLEPVELPHLRRFELSDEFSITASSFFELVSFPNVQFIDLQIFMDSSVEGDHRRLRKMLEHALLSPNPPPRPSTPPIKFEPPRSLHIEQFDSCGARGNLSFYPLPNSDPRRDAPVSICFQRDSPSFYDSMTTLLDVIGTSSLTRLEKLSICARSREGIPVDVVVKYFGGLETLQHLVIQGIGGSARSLGEAIGKEIGGNNNRRQGVRSCAFEGLRTIRFEVDDLLSLSIDQSSRQRGIRIGDILVGGLRLRKEIMGSVGVESIVIDGPFVLDEGELVELRRFVPDTAVHARS
ncbi:hypothetical protein AAF712_006581 [Marasmius tenuissimus]|uniref:F-box domain-containing protein n=1 Tax=Marasmius tenuissimus TaxID=585030 RepID=A0ABR2ZY70_9AGAR